MYGIVRVLPSCRPAVLPRYRATTNLCARSSS